MRRDGIPRGLRQISLIYIFFSIFLAMGRVPIMISAQYKKPDNGVSLNVGRDGGGVGSSQCCHGGRRGTGVPRQGLRMGGSQGRGGEGPVQGLPCRPAVLRRPSRGSTVIVFAARLRGLEELPQAALHRQVLQGL